jgi:hypothetical protein
MIILSRHTARFDMRANKFLTIFFEISDILGSVGFIFV